MLNCCQVMYSHVFLTWRLSVQAATSDEGGVAAGFAVLDSPLLTP